MMLKDGMLLYHGSYARIDNIDLSKSAFNKDFGRGFYLTSNELQAKSFIKTSLLKAKRLETVPVDQSYGYVTVFKYHEPENGLNVFEFDNSSKDWLWFIAINRREQLAKNLLPFIDRRLFDADVIAGKIANDTTNPVLTTYMNGLYGDIDSDVAISFAIQQLMPDHLYDQYCFKTNKSIACLEYTEALKYEF